MTVSARSTRARRASRSDAPVPVTGPDRGRAAAEEAISGATTTLNVLGLHVKLPPPEQLAFLAGVGLLAALEIIEWPVALVLALGHGLVLGHHGRVLRGFGTALEEA
jgi:hypothetical protein